MANYNDIQDTTIFVTTNPIPEPLGSPRVFSAFTERFDPNLYNLWIDSHLYRFLLALVGDSGAGLIAKQENYARFQQYLASTHFQDLDKFYANLGLPRLSIETYSINDIDGQPLDPRGQTLTPGQWEDVTVKDSSYRARCLAWTQALALGGTPEGLSKAAEAALGVECQVFENYKYLDRTYNQQGVQPNLANNSQNRKQFVVVPQIPASQITQEQQYYLYNLLNRLKPVGTFFTINFANSPRIQIVPADVTTTSNFFYVTRHVTGNNNLKWPVLDSSKGFWIEAGITNAAPTSAFMLSQEYVNTFPISTATASSYQIGPFNNNQQAFFGNLKTISPDTISYLATNSYSVNNTPIYSTAGWANGYNTNEPLLMVNTYYPLEYFSITNTQLQTDSPTRFWGSIEQANGTTETLTLDLGETNQVNFIDFLITQKPIILSFQYSIDNVNWVNTTFATEFDYSNQISFVPSNSNPWFYYQAHFDVFRARFLRITFTRNGVLSDPVTFEAFNWSIDVKNIRIGHQINNLEDILDADTLQPATSSTKNYLTDTSVDVFGNQFITDYTIQESGNVLTTSNLYWQSQPNPSPFAIENLYFDLRDVNLNPQVITELFIDPLTLGCSMHFYWTNDDSNNDDWDNKLWSPITTSHILRKGYYHLPGPVSAKYFKIEFSRLQPAPYNPIEYPETPAISFRKYPTWVQDYFLSNFPVTLNSKNLQFPFASVGLNNQNTGFEHSQTILDSGNQVFPPNTNFINNAINDNQNNLVVASTRTTINTTNRTQVGNQIKIVNNTTFKDSFNGFDLNDPLSRFLFNTASDSANIVNTLITSEAANPTFSPPLNQSVIDLSQEETNKKYPLLYFPFTCRHAYQELSVKRTDKIAWYVAVKFVGFFRRDFTQQYDEKFYYETLADSFNLQQNDFIQSDWNYTLPT